MAMFGLGYRKPLVGTGWAISLLCMNELGNSLSAMYGLHYSVWTAREIAPVLTKGFLQPSPNMAMLLLSLLMVLQLENNTVKTSI